MRLKKLHVTGFGKLVDFDISFDDGLNVLNRPNGFGKSTLSSFIFAMFYGLPDNTRRKDSDNLRKRFKPWRNAVGYGGSLVFEKDGIDYLIEREFGDRQSSDKLRVVQEASGATADFGEIVGEGVFGIDAEGFTRCVYLPQINDKITNNDSITRKLTEVLNDTEGVRFKAALERLDDFRAQISKTGKRGLIDKLKSEHHILWDRIRKADDILADVDRRTVEIQDSTDRLAAIKADIELCRKNVAVNELIKERDELRRRVDEGERRRADAEEYGRKARYTREELVTVEKRVAELSETIEIDGKRKEGGVLLRERELLTNAVREAEQRVSSCPKIFKILPDDAFFIKASEYLGERQTIVLRKEELVTAKDAAQLELSALKPPEKSKKKPLVFFIIAALLLAISAALVLLKVIDLQWLGFGLMIGFGAVSVIFAVSALKQSTAYGTRIAVYNDKRLALNNEIGLLDDRISKFGRVIDTCNAEMKNLLAGIGVKSDNVQADFDTVVEQTRELKGLYETAEAKRNALNDFMRTNVAALKEAEFYDRERDAENRKLLNGLEDKRRALIGQNAEFTAAAAEARKSAEGYSSCGALLEVKERELKAAQAELSKTVILPEERLKEMTERHARELRTLTERETELKVIRGGAPDPTALRDEYDVLSERITLLEGKLDSAMTVRRLLSEANDRLAGNYLPVMREHFKDFLMMVNAHYADIEIDNDFNIRLTEMGFGREIDLFSVGTKDLMYFGLRLCLMMSMYGDNLPFVILDDCFTNLDAERFSSVKKLLNDLAKTSQVIYLTCYRE